MPSECGAHYAHGAGHNVVAAGAAEEHGWWCMPHHPHSHGGSDSSSSGGEGAAPTHKHDHGHGHRGHSHSVADHASEVHACETHAFHNHQMSLEAREAVVRAWVFLGAMSLHALFDGLSLGAEGSWQGFYGVMVAVLVHKVFDGLAVGAAVYPAGFSWKRSAAMLAFCALMTPVGIAIGLGATEAVSGPRAALADAIIVSMSAGSFLFISISELLPASLHDGRRMAVKLAGFALGWAAMIILAGFV